MTPSRGPLLLASIHDVSPRFESEIDRLLDLLEPSIGNRLAMLVVPNHWGDAPIVPGSRFATRLRGWADDGIEIFLHGYVHRDEARHSGATDRIRARFMTAGEGEFLGSIQRRSPEPDQQRKVAGRRGYRAFDRRFRRARMALRARRTRSVAAICDPDCRRPYARLVADIRPDTRSRSGHHLGEPDAAAPGFFACRRRRPPEHPAQRIARRRPSA